MNEEPGIPTPIPRGPLWLSLLAPPVVVTLVMLLICLSGVPREFLIPVPAILFFPLLSFLYVFNGAVGKRYKGTSLLVLGWFYFLGQVIVCFTVWVGSCVIVS
ncbi:MAG: hypothetical protein ABIS50_10915 [Luteolibacter sp.]|uniref:hypothetical protein n=1 Tax=Luteolibacter sp. TaxID=1962973 RepID=UPI003265647D